MISRHTHIQQTVQQATANQLRLCLTDRCISMAHGVSSLISVKLHHSTVVTLTRSPSSKANSITLHHPVSGIYFLMNFANLLIISPCHCHLISNTPFHCLLHQHFHHPSLLFSTPGSKLFFSIHSYHHSSLTDSIDSNCF